jgi:tripartite-type tricarboxylate transporter receptor subunit TctC
MKQLTRLAFSVCAAIISLAGSTASAQTSADPLPKGNITIVVPTPPAGPADIVARILAAKLSETTGRTFIVDNKAGAGFNLGSAYVAKAQPDGLTWLYTPDSVLTVNPWLYPSQGFAPVKDLIPVARVEDVLLILAINPEKVPAKNFAELVELSKTRTLSFGSAGIGSPGHLALEYLKSVSPLQASHVPYRGASLAMQDLIGGQIDAAFIVGGVLVPYVKSGALRALAVSANQRLSSMPDIPTAAEAGIKDFEARFSNMLLAPAGTPENTRRYIAEKIGPILDLPDVRERLKAMAEDPTARHDGEDAAAWLDRERERWGRVIKTANIKAE